MTHARSGTTERGGGLPGVQPGSFLGVQASEFLWLLPAGLLVLEILALQARFSTAQFAALDTGWGRILLALREVPRIALMAVTALFVLGRRGLTEELAFLHSAAGSASGRWSWISLQVGSFALLWASAALLLDRDPTGAPPSRLLLAGWPVLAGITSALALQAIAPWQAWRDALRRRWRLVLTALLVGVLAWVAGAWSQEELREALRLPTLRVAFFLLEPFAEGAFIAPEAFQFGTAHFSVDLAPGCSGLDGIGLVGTFTLAWLLWVHRELRFPGALLLLPLGIVTSWLLNAARLAALVLVGEHASGEAAVAGFHSVAGLVLFCATAIGIVALGHSAPFQRSRALEHAPLLDATAAYLLPLVLWIGVGLLATAFPVDPAARLAARGTAAVIALAVGRRHLGELLGRPTWAGLVTAAVCVVLALALPRPLQADLLVQHAPQNPVHGILALLAALVFAPVLEELAFRGYLMRRPASPHFETVAPRAAGVVGIALSSVLFGVLHPAWHVGIAFGLLYALAYCWKGRLSDAIVAHALTNLALIAVLG